MFLSSIKYSEHVGNPNEWRLDQTKFANVNLLVGNNATGKTRVANIINSLALLLSGRLGLNFANGLWSAEFKQTKGKSLRNHSYLLKIENQCVVQEQYKIESDVILDRGADGVGFVLKKGSKERIKYKVPKHQLMAVVRRDEIQHPFFEPLHRWARNLCLYRFGSEFGKDEFQLPAPNIFGADFYLSDFIESPGYVFSISKERFGSEFEECLLSDINSIGYDCSQVFLVPVDTIRFNGLPPMALAVKERAIHCHTTQTTMSQGMYRAIALLIQVNANIFWARSMKVGQELQDGDTPLVVIDDIGEGLDHERASLLISLLMKKAETYKMQLLMSTNDRYVMNGMPLEYWTVLHREGCVVCGINKISRPSVFEEFDMYGLNNFDFLAGKFYAADK